jgi:2-(1,2-epoxy-1,2-dihydrophenyl)acetyl-CoA isomerase
MERSMMQNAGSTIRLEIRDHVAWLIFSRPDSANTINLQFGREFLASVLAIEAQLLVRAVVMTGQGRAFCFGGDLKGMAASGGDVQKYLSELTTDLHAGMARLVRLNAPVIAGVNGTAAGAGLGLVLAADLAIAGRSAKFVASYTGVGLTPDAGCTFLLPRAIGAKRAMELLLTNRVLDAQTALDWGLVNEVIDDDTLLDHVGALASRLAAGPVGAFGAVKRLAADAQPGFEAQLEREGRSIASRGVSDEGREGINAFLEKRSPRYF